MKKKEQMKEYYDNIAYIFLALAFVSLLFFLIVADQNGVFELVEFMSFLLIFIFGILGGVYLFVK